MNKGKNLSESDLSLETAAGDPKAIREAKDISLRDIFLATRISMHNLAAIEEGRFQLLPEPVYARTFIKTYAEFLGIDSRPLLDNYEKYLKSIKVPPVSGDVADKRPDREKTSDRRYRLFLWIGIPMALAFCLLYLVFSTDSERLHLSKLPEAPSVTPPGAPRPEVPPAVPGSSPPAPVREPATLAPAAEGTLPGRSPENRSEQGTGRPVTVQQAQTGTLGTVQNTEVQGHYRLVITGIEKTWLRIRQDQKPPQEMMLNRGDVIERFASDTFTVDIGNAGGIEIAFQGKPLGPLGESGQVVHLKLP